MAQDPYRYFRVEARELLEQLGQATLELEKEGARAELVQRLLRFGHTLKGAARVVKQREIANEAHAIEEIVAPYRQTPGPVRREAVDGLLRLIDSIGTRLSALGPEAPGAAPVKVHTEELFQLVRADVAEVDALLDGLAETHIQLNSLRKAAGQMDRTRHLGEMLCEQLAAHRHRAPLPPTGAAREQASAVAEDLRRSFAAIERTIGGAVEQMDRELRQVRDAAEHLRLVPAGALFNSLERIARDTAHALGKEVLFEGRGGDIRIDPHVLEALRTALVQIVRNAVAHGIEPAVQRSHAGKPAAGRVRVEVLRRGRRVVFRCQDDGRGVDLDAVRRIAAKRGLLPAEAEPLGSEEIVRLLLRGGISTSAAVTEVSGRGVGLDVVRETLERLGGEILVRTAAGHDTVFDLIVPLTLASIEGLSVESSGIVATLPLDAVKRAIRVTPGQLSRTADGESLVFEGKVIPFLPLARALQANPAKGRAQPARTEAAVIVEAGGRLAALGVDRLLGKTRVVLSALAPADPITAGASLDIDGNPQLVLSPEGLLEAASRAMSLASRPEAARQRILVIDDSLTTRMLERSILESAGYDVDTAISGEEALDLARRKSFTLFLVDVEMPGMDGFTFIERVRAEPSLRDIPAILVTSRAAPEDVERGTRAGAQGHIAKSDFDQSDLLARIKQLAG